MPCVWEILSGEDALQIANSLPSQLVDMRSYTDHIVIEKDCFVVAHSPNSFEQLPTLRIVAFEGIATAVCDSRLWLMCILLYTVESLNGSSQQGILFKAMG